MAFNATEFLLGEEVARKSFKQLLKEEYQRAKSAIDTLKAARRANPGDPKYWQYIYEALAHYQHHIKCYAKPIQKIIWYCIRNFPSKAFLVERNIQHWYYLKSKLNRYRRSKRYYRGAKRFRIKRSYSKFRRFRRFTRRRFFRKSAYKRRFYRRRYRRY